MIFDTNFSIINYREETNETTEALLADNCRGSITEHNVESCDADNVIKGNLVYSATENSIV